MMLTEQMLELWKSLLTAKPWRSSLFRFELTTFKRLHHTEARHRSRLGFVANSMYSPHVLTAQPHHLWLLHCSRLPCCISTVPGRPPLIFNSGNTIYKIIVMLPCMWQKYMWPMHVSETVIKLRNLCLVMFCESSILLSTNSNYSFWVTNQSR